MKKAIALLCGAMLALALVACGGAPAPKIESLDDLEGKSIGVQQGTTGDIYAADAGYDVQRFPTGANAVMALQQGKVDAVIIDDQPARVYVQQNTDLTLLADPFEEEQYAICVAKDNQSLTAEMNVAISELKNNGTLQSLMDFYIGKVEGAAPYQSPEGTQYPNGTLTMATNAAFPPYEYWEGDKIMGLDVDFSRAICDALGYELVVEDMEFDSIIVAVQTGKADFGAAAMTMTEERLANIDFTDTYCTATQVVIVKK